MARITRALILLMTTLVARPAFAQMNFSGEWAPVQDEDNTGNPYTGEFIVGGDEKFASEGKTFTGGNVIGDLGDVAEGAAILAHENVFSRPEGR